ncbi:hypothetical protein BN946_scf184799.g69 [Trametes cinnabarina]|uniref:Uncharacterized protein n=1 Tax=Pycnoporus cinnabarinus TaxID=5643 RepID=A0A060S1X4_PYCCI|nr:hypothetical protein BN946_scf184799.g69 [Trametes cinnabarina]
MDSPLSILSSPSQASEPSSVASNRVFFGPVLSPEKRSARLSSAMVPLPLFPQQQPGSSSSREETPDEDGILDEPSVVLASRVLSAAGNPSPPPSPPLPPQTDALAFMDVQFLDAPVSPQPQQSSAAIHGGPLIPIEETAEPVAVSSPAVAFTPATRKSLPLDTGNVSQPDLINFDSFSASHDHDPPTSTQAQDQSRPLVQLSISTIDDLLSMSPHPPRTEQFPTQAIDERAVFPVEAQSDATSPEEMEVENSLILESDEPILSVPVADILHPQVEGLSESTQECDGETSPPPRRSSRPRKSRSSLPRTITSINPRPTDITANGAEETVECTAEQIVEGSQTSPVRKRKLKGIPQTLPLPMDNCTDTASPKRLPRVDIVRRDLGSLSPVSAAVLQQLLPGTVGESASRSTTPQPPQQSEQAGPSNQVPAPSTPPPQTVNLIFPKVGSQADGGASEIQRPRSPLRPFPLSPAKLDDTMRTPARRVPIAQAIAEGTYSAQKLPALFSAPRPTAAPGSPVFKRLALDDPARSPAKRVPMSEAIFVPPPSSPGKDKEVARPSSPVRPPTRERQRSGAIEPRPLPGRQERGSSAEPTTRLPALGRRPLFQKPASSDGVPSTSKARSALPFPLVQAQRLHPAIPEADESGLSVVRPPMGAANVAESRVKASPAKATSSLRQPSAGASSKIPRIGVKPYARPTAAGKREVAASKLPAPPASRVAPKSLRIVNVGSSSSGSSSDEGHGSVPPTSKPPRRPIAGPSSSEASSVHGLKRKRDTEGSQASAPAMKPVIMIRKVVPGMFNKGEPSSIATEQSPAKPSSPGKATGPIKARSAVHWKRPQTEIQQAPPPPAPVPPVPVSLKSPSPESTPGAFVPDVQPPVTEPSPAKAHEEPPPIPLTAPQSAPSVELPDGGPSDPPPDLKHKSGREHRRSTRSKRTQDHVPTTDVFGIVEPAPTRSARTTQTRRKPGPLPSETGGPFAGMSALALKTLTSANTIKNQQQVVVIKTEVVRKEGARPDSPTTKVRTALDRQREERMQQRKERAARRARRSGGDETGDASIVGEGHADTGADASFVSVDRDAEGQPLRHRRGPGDEDDYETPPRPERPVKRARFDGVEAQGGEKEVVPEKRVKWDKGLHTTVYLDDTPPRPRRNKDAAPSQKGCLTSAAKALRLDTMGNVLNAELPVGGIVRENIVVKKFVFDDDVEPEVASPAPVKSTRSKAKKTKS